MVNIVVPMAGAGSRFLNAGYKKPKPFIDVLGKSMIKRVLENLHYNDANYIFILRKEHIADNLDVLKDLEKSCKASFVYVDKLTEGAACTVLFANRSINNDQPLLIANSDQIVDIKIANYIDDAFSRKLDGSILTFADNDAKWSYAKLDKDNLVTEVREKQVISNHATVGIYFYTKGSDFVNCAIDMIVNNDRVNNEFYVCPAYNYLIKQGGKVGIYEIKKSQMHGTGTPEDFKQLPKVNWMMYNLIPLAGPDLKMKDGNFRPLYEVDSQPLIIRTLKSRNWYNEDDNFIFVLRQVDGIDRLKSFLCNNFKNCQIVTISDLTKGALISCLSGFSLIKNYDKPICVDLADIIYDCDFVPVSAFKNDPELYGIIPSFKSNNPKFSYLKIENNKITETKEKFVISDNASAGTYFFKDLPSFLNAISWSIQNEEKVSFKNNLFLCPSYNFFISSGKKIENFEVRNVKPISSIFCDIT